MAVKYISAEGLEKLKAELKELVEIKRPEVVKRIQEAKEQGDLRENAEYHEAKESQAFIEGRILELEDTIKNGVLVDASKGDVNMVQVGHKVKIDCNGSKMEYHIVGSDEADPMSGKISSQSPMGKAFLGKRVGDVVEIQVPAGKMACKILHIGV